jgi:hypothetical protein
MIELILIVIGIVAGNLLIAVIFSKWWEAQGQGKIGDWFE